ncbi:MAG: YqiA/YcfP family alpha/beta fold hydrolase [Burkholderiaceae bacterium]
MILYLHGFRSSPRSTKARQLDARLTARGLGASYRCPQLPVSPREAAEAIERIVAEAEGPLAIIGSSLGGYYATWIAERVDCRVVLLNPATHPDRDLVRHLGPQTVYDSDETIDVKPEYLDELKVLRVGDVTCPDRYLLVAATGDEVLDWREMIARYPDAHRRVIAGSDHGLSDFGTIIDDVIDFAIGRR